MAGTTNDGVVSFDGGTNNVSGMVRAHNGLLLIWFEKESG